ncbi:hypothetical protein J8273_0987 [Carpediemonas membranifera]|uniref:Uncharacterized protein n=1 Tax=Carpediemonas membranifera TaxID=201153 RepID=A0A8J6BB63_9EUKA|nr:hypothetical protein J8273_0987 [Carpediemonas membranifera]|eukprot:KAG9397079.1 hypothetical protein J8273_0987 [Carpediemonas membranifera]
MVTSGIRQDSQQPPSDIPKVQLERTEASAGLDDGITHQSDQSSKNQPQIIAKVHGTSLIVHDAAIPPPPPAKTRQEAQRTKEKKGPKAKRRVYTYEDKMRYILECENHGMDKVLAENPQLRKASLLRWISSRHNGELKQVKRGPKPRADRDHSVFTLLESQGVKPTEPISADLLVTLKEIYCQAFPEQSLGSLSTFRKAVIRVRERVCGLSELTPGQVAEEPPRATGEKKAARKTKGANDGNAQPDPADMGPGLHAATSIPSFEGVSDVVVGVGSLDPASLYLSNSFGSLPSPTSLRQFTQSAIDEHLAHHDPRQFIGDLGTVLRLVDGVCAGRWVDMDEPGEEDRAGLRRAARWLRALAEAARVQVPAL